MPVIRINPKISVSVVFVAAMFMNIMDITIVNVALPSIGRQFKVSETALDSVAVGYLVSLAIIIPAAGWLGDRFGSKRILLVAIALFTVASVLCGLADSLPELVTFRVVQGVGGGMLTPVGMAMLFRTFPPKERVRASSILTVPTAAAPAIGPVLGGLLVTDLSWRWVFFVNLPIGIAAFVFGLIFLEEHHQPHPGRFDLPGFALSGIGFALVMFGVSEGPDKGWGSLEIVGTIVLGLVLLAWLIPVELRAAQPLLKLRLYGNRLFRSTSLVITITMGAILGVLFTAPLFFQIALGLSALQSGLTTFPEAIGVMLGAQVASRLLYWRFGPRRLVAGGLIGMACSMGLMPLIGVDTSLWWMRVLMFTMGLSMAQVIVSSQAASFATISHADTGGASSLFNSGRQLGGALGVALVTTVLASVGATHLVDGHTAANLAGYHAAFVAGAALALVGAVIALSINDADADATMVRLGAPREKSAPAPAVAVAVAVEPSA
jgi:EmrB/QacA subfamily drug resistance transporter